MKKLIICMIIPIFLISCIKKEMPFDKKIWHESMGEIRDIRGNKRCRMVLWLEQNYKFTGKTAEEIIDKFEGVWEDHVNYLYFRNYYFKKFIPKVIENKKLVIPVKHKDLNGFTFFPNPSKIVGIKWIELYFDEKNCVKEAFFVEYDLKNEDEIKRKME